jgi:hypothetical protein
LIESVEEVLQKRVEPHSALRLRVLLVVWSVSLLHEHAATVGMLR